MNMITHLVKVEGSVMKMIRMEDHTMFRVIDLPPPSTKIHVIGRKGIRQREISQADLWPSTATNLSSPNGAKRSFALFVAKITIPWFKVVETW
jgi:hypothetical protein